MSDKPWGHIEDGKFVPLPKGPMIHANLGPPPFDVEMPDGRIRHIIEQPDPDDEQGTPSS